MPVHTYPISYACLYLSHIDSATCEQILENIHIKNIRDLFIIQRVSNKNLIPQAISPTSVLLKLHAFFL